MATESSPKLYDEIPGWQRGAWRDMLQIVHDSEQIHGFFGPYRWLSNFGRAIIELDGVKYSSVEIAYQAAKRPMEDRGFFATCSNKDAIVFNREHPLDKSDAQTWDERRVEVMRLLLLQKFDPQINPENHRQLMSTGWRHLEETNWWDDRFWGVDLEGNGENNLGKLLMWVREKLDETCDYDPLLYHYEQLDCDYPQSQPNSSHPLGSYTSGLLIRRP